MEVDPSFDEFVSSGSPRLLRSAYLLTGDRGYAEDLLQVTLVRTARRWERARSAPAAYAHRVLINLVHDRHRRLARRVSEQPFDERHPGPATAVDHAEPVITHDAIIRAVKRLPPRQREVVVLRFFADLSVSETAQAISASSGSVKTHTTRALSRLRELLDDEPGALNRPRAEVPGAD